MINTKLLKTISESEKVVGTKQVLKSIEGNGIEIISVPSKKELGRISGIDVPAAVVGLK